MHDGVTSAEGMVTDSLAIGDQMKEELDLGEVRVTSDVPLSGWIFSKTE